MAARAWETLPLVNGLERPRDGLDRQGIDERTKIIGGDRIRVVAIVRRKILVVGVTAVTVFAEATAIMAARNGNAVIGAPVAEKAGAAPMPGCRVRYGLGGVSHGWRGAGLGNGQRARPVCEEDRGQQSPRRCK